MICPESLISMAYVSSGVPAGTLLFRSIIVLLTHVNAWCSDEGVKAPFALILE